MTLDHSYTVSHEQACLARHSSKLAGMFACFPSQAILPVSQNTRTQLCFWIKMFTVIAVSGCELCSILYCENGLRANSGTFPK